MIKWKHFLVLTVLLLFLSISIVSATNNTTSETTNTIEITTHNPEKVVTSTEVKQTEKENKIINKKNTTQNTKTAPISINNYTTLHETLTSDTSTEVTINIENNIILEGTTTINNTIKTLNINGNNKTINGDEQWQFISIPSGTIVNINNITITNCRANDSGAIENHGNLTITKTILFNNTVTENGGALINYAGNVNITESILINNTAHHNGGAIDNSGNMLVYNCTLDNNDASFAGSIINNGNISITQSTIKNSDALIGGVIINSHSTSNLIITNSNISNCHAITYDGGAIENHGNLIITQSILDNNTANRNGGAILNTGGNLIITDSNITNNRVTNPTGYVINIANSKTVIIKDNIFINNTDKTRDMLFSDASESVNLDIHGNTYIDNYLDVNITGDNVQNITTTTNMTFNYPVNVTLRTIYNTTVNTGYYTVKSDNIDTKAMIQYGNSIVEIENSNLSVKDNVILLEYVGEGNNYQNGRYNFTIHKIIPTYLSLELSPNSKVDIDDNLKITVTLVDDQIKALEGHEITIIINEEKYDLKGKNKTDTNGQIIFYYPITEYTINDIPGKLKIIAEHNEYNETTYYNSSKNEKKTLTINQVGTHIQVSVDNHTMEGKNATVSIELYENLTEQKVVGETITYNVTDADGNTIIANTNTTTISTGIKIILPALPKTGYDVNIEYAGKEKYLSTRESKEILPDYHISKLEVIVEGTALINQTKEVTITLKDSNNENIKGENIVWIKINNDKEYPVVLSNGIIKFNQTYPYAARMNITATFQGSGKYDESQAQAQYTVTILPTKISGKTIENNKTVNTTIILTINDEIDNKPVNGGNITLTDNNDKVISQASVNNGKATFTITTLKEGEHNLKATYNGDKNIYNTTEDNITVTVEKIKTDITATITNNTRGNVTVEIRAFDEYSRPLKGHEVEVTLPNKTSIKTITDKNGKFTITDSTITEGNTKITVTIKDTDDIRGSTKIIPVTVIPNYPKIIEELNKSIQDLNKTIPEKEKTISNLTKTIKDLKENNKKLEDEINKLSKELDKLERTTVITGEQKGNTLGNTTINIKLENQIRNPIKDATVKILTTNKTILGQAKTDKNGKTTIPVNMNTTQPINIIYEGNSQYTKSESKLTVIVNKNNVTITLSPINGIIGENIKLTARLRDQNGNFVNGGNLVFKLNGKTLRNDGRFDSKAPAMKFKVVNGLVTYTIKADLYIRNSKNLTAVYSGTYKYEEAKSSTVTAQIKKRNAKLTLTTTPKTQQQYNTIKFTAKLEDTTPNTKNTTAMSTNTKVIFKVNGKTIKDKTGKNLQVKVVNNTATYKYTVPAGMGGITKDGRVRYYKVEAVLISDIYYPDTKDYATFNVERKPVKINITRTSINSKNVLNVQATIKDFKGNKIIGSNNVALKINGKSYINPATGKVKYWSVKNGVVNLKGIQVNTSITVKKVMLVTGDRQAYLGGRTETTKIIKA